MLIFPCENSLESIAAICDANIGQIPMYGELRDNQQRIHDTCVKLSQEQRVYTRDEYVEACGRFSIEPMSDAEVDCYGIRFPDSIGPSYDVSAIVGVDLAVRRLKALDTEKPPKSVSIPAWFTEQFSRCNQCGECNPQTTIAGGGVCDDCL